MNWKQTLFSFRGRIGRARYWVATVATILVMVLVVFVLQRALRHAPLIEPTLYSGRMYLALMLVFGWPIVAIQAKRWHDLNMTAWLMLVNLVPGVGALVVLVCCGFLPGTKGANRFGEQPGPLSGAKRKQTVSRLTPHSSGPSPAAGSAAELGPLGKGSK